MPLLLTIKSIYKDYGLNIFFMWQLEYFSCGVECTFLGMKMSDEPNQDIIGIETNYTMSRDNVGEWTGNRSIVKYNLRNNDETMMKLNYPLCA